jgi:hypothetical protein
MTKATLKAAIQKLHPSTQLEIAEWLMKKQKEGQPIKKRIFGCAKGKVKMAEDFNAPLDVFIV